MNFDDQLKEVINFIELIGKDDKYYTPRKITKTIGKKYIKLIYNYLDESTGSVYCFIDKSTGDIYKAAGWSRPAKHARASIFEPENWKGRLLEFGPLYLN